MPTTRTVLAVSLALAAGSAQAQQEAPSPYSLGFSVGRVPIGLNASFVGRATLSSFSAFGKLGAASTTRADTALTGMSSTAMALPEAGAASGLSWGGGVSWDVSPQLTATFEWISYDLRMPTGPVRSTSLGLRYKY